MSDAGASQPMPEMIGQPVDPPFVRLPDPSTLFRVRAQRFAVLAQTHQLAPYLHFMAGLSEAQHRTCDGLPEPAMPDQADLDRAREYAMPPFDRGRFKTDAALDATFEKLFSLAPQIDMPDQARAALARATALDGAARAEMTALVLNHVPPGQRAGEYAFVAAALQAHFARLASRLAPKSLVPVGEGACPACGSPPVASMVVDWPNASGVRYCACSLCSTFWHVVRVKCVCCGSTGGISYEEIADGPSAGQVRAETCQTCKSYVKIMLAQKDPSLDPFADDVATLGLDLLVRETGLRRGGVDPFLIGY
ncbi:MAG: formate dehydrogenase accessory protein FdhE [Beijerinckiaceae bacterium]